MRYSVLLFFCFAVATAAADDAPPRTVSVVGTGTASAAPDRALVSMSINSRARQLATAQSGAAKVVAAVLELTDELDIERRRVDTTGATVQPDYRWNQDTNEQELRGYIASRQMVVSLSDLEKLGRLVEGAVEAGVNQVSPPQLVSGRRAEAQREALRAAAADARANAEVLADSLGAELGNVLQINANSHSPRPPVAYQRSAMAMEADSAPATYNAGDLTFNTTVNVTFELLD